jgi:3-oxoacyl-[acyl-carrier protein] reductase
MTLAGKIALVTGGSRGIGRAISLKLAFSGAYTIVNFAQNEKAAQDTIGMIRDGNGSGETMPFDVSDFQRVQEAIGHIAKDKGRLDILVNNAGISSDGLFVRIKEEDWDRVMASNLKGVFNCCRAAARHMMKQRWGRIVNISSVVAALGNTGQVSYGASKAGIEGLTRSMARELGSRNICINAVAPRFIDVGMTSSIKGEDRERVKQLIPLNRMGTPEDVAGVVRFLVSEDAAYMTGQTLHINGGLYM